LKGGLFNGAAAVTCGQQVEVSTKWSTTQPWPLYAEVWELMMPAKSHSCGAVNTVVRGPRIFRVIYTVVIPCVGVGDAI
jgi:hypothetical protein